MKQEKLDERGERIAEGYETESIWHCEYPTKFSPILKVYGNNTGNKAHTGVLDFDGGATTITKTYEAVSQYLGFGFIEAGKTMGLAHMVNKMIQFQTCLMVIEALKMYSCFNVASWSIH